MAYSNSKPTQIYSFQETSNHAFSMSIMHDKENKYQPYFIFMNLTPGESTAEGGRSFNYQSPNAVAMKLKPIKIAELGHALTAYARGQSAMIGKFTIFVDSSKSNYSSSGGKKSVNLNYFPGDNNKPPTMSLSFKKDGMDKSVGFMMSITNALAIADACSMIYKHTIKLDMTSDNTYTSNENTKTLATNSVPSGSIEGSGGYNTGFESGPFD